MNNKNSILETAWFISALLAVICLSQALPYAFQDEVTPEDVNEFVKWAIFTSGCVFAMAYLSEATGDKEK